MSRDICTRCKTPLFTTTDPVGEHLCKDIRKRLERRQKQVDIILGIMHDIAPWRSNEAVNIEMAQLIAQKITGFVSDED